MVIVIDRFSKDFSSLTKDWNWEVEGFLDTKGYVHPIDTDTKVISTVFERLASPVIRTIAKSSEYICEVANQTTYPDFTLSLIDNDKKLLHRIAIDIKTTYYSKQMLFTLGGYNSFLRNGTKNILYPYSTYDEHWIIGFIYSQNPKFIEYDLSNMPKKGQIACPYTNVSVFIREKHAISGLRAGSGNTKNIGSVKLNNPSLFLEHLGPFLSFTKAREACDHYWKNYEKYYHKNISITELLNHEDFVTFI